MKRKYRIIQRPNGTFAAQVLPTFFPWWWVTLPFSRDCETAEIAEASIKIWAARDERSNSSPPMPKHKIIKEFEL